MVLKNKELFTEDNSNDTTTTSVSAKLANYLSKGSLFLFFFLLLTVNLVALSISLQCNVGSGNILYKIASGMFAFMFGILYIIFNYYMYRIKVNNKPCVICRTNLFELSF
jgi:hypothetical protein